MPLLKKKRFEKSSLPEFLRDDEEVFYCAVTNEIFRDYEDFSERMFLCNSMVWTCSLTGKANLTYAEALESEEHAKKSLKEFPPELKVPILYLASKTKRTAFGDMADDVFTYARERYFIGENVETSFTGTKWKDAHVLQVIAPPLENNEKTPSNNIVNGNVEDHHSQQPLPSLYKYEIEHLDADDEDISEIMIVDCNQIRRKKGSFSREKCKLFLKQYVEQDDWGIFVIKTSAMKEFKISDISFQQIFNGPIPSFGISKKIEKALNGVKKVRQESLHKFLIKSNNTINGSNNDLLEKIKKKEEEREMRKQEKKERKMALKQKKKEENLLIAGHLKDWYRPKEDLELTDHKKLPNPTPIKTKIPEKYFGDMLMILEFVNCFSKLLSTKDFFPGGLTIEIMERALTENEVAGPYIDLIQMLLTALFNVQDEEASQYKTQIENISNIKFEDTTNNMNLREATRHATIAYSWSDKYQGLPLGRLPLYSLTTSEVLRLHLLGSGAIINNTGARWRYQQRGGYLSEDDPGLYLRLHSPHILKALKVHNVVQLPISDKLTILSCLTNQLLTYADVRDIVEEQIEKVKQAKIDYKLTLAAEKRREHEFLAAKKKIEQSSPELDKLEYENETKKAENEQKLEQYIKGSCENQIVLGQDRAFHQYLKLKSVPGLFVNFEEENVGTCLNSIIKQDPDLIDATRDKTVAHIKKMVNNTENSPSKSPKKINGARHSLLQQNIDLCHELNLCSADSTNCVVHSTNQRTNKWYFYHEKEKFSDLIESLNKRGMRESKLQQSLKNHRKEIEKFIEKTPVNYLNSELPIKDREEPKQSKRHNKVKYDDVNLGYPPDMSTEDILHNALVENILEMEEKIFAGNLGSLFIKDREKWRNCIQNKNYKDLDKTIIKRNKVTNQDSSDKGVQSNTTEISNLELLQDYKDPGHFLDTLNDQDFVLDSNEILFDQKAETQVAIHNLAIALIQVAQAVEPKYLKKPLGRTGVNQYDSKKKENMLNHWEQSLLASTSFSQVFLHYGTLDSCVMWAKSVLLARCRICRRQNDSENMLLCDSCNWGHHLYCLKPQLKSVPAGDWFCNKCQKEKKIENPSVPQPPVKKRPIFRDEEIDEEDDVEPGNNEESGDLDEDESLEEEDYEEEDDDDEIVFPIKVQLCKTCRSGGELIDCENCSDTYHIECVDPPLRRAPRSWTCSSCKRNNRRRRRYRNFCNGTVVQRTGVMNGQRRCAAQALYKIHDFAKSLRQQSESEDSSEDEVINKRSTRRDEGRTDLPLHNAALHEVLSEIMKDNNAWPFLRPVQKNEVPDYYDVITKPMDFGTIKYKLNMGEYKEDAEFMSDALLVFQNCNTYNHTEDDVYKCGVQLLKRFQKKCREIGLKLPEEMDYNDNSERPKKKMRTK